MLELVGAIQHQLQEMKFFAAISIETPPGDPSVASQVDRAVPNVSNNTLVKLEHAPQTNLGCESSFSVFDNMVDKCGGGTSIKTLSSKRVVSQNKFLVRPEMLNLDSIMNAIKPESDLQDVDFILDQYFLNKKDVSC